MSVVYSIKETMNIKNEGNYKILVSKLRYQYSLLGALMLNDDAKIIDMTLTADGETYPFNGDVVTPEFKVFLDKLSNAKEIALTAEYEYWWRTGYDSLNIGPFAVCDLAEELLKEGEIEASGFFYAMHNSADCEQGYGVLTAFGENNGKKYCGVVKNEITENFPKDGEWCSVETLICCDLEDLSSVNVDEVIAACRAFDAMNGDYSLDVTEDALSFYLNAIAPLKSEEDFKKFIDLINELDRTVSAGDGMGYWLQFIDQSGDIPRLLEIDFEADGSRVIKIAAV